MQTTIPTLPTDCPLPDGLPLLGQVFECVDDDFSGTPEVEAAYPQLPRKGHTYTLNEIHLGFDSDRQLVYAGNFVELPLAKPGGGFFLRRFHPCIDNPSTLPHWHPDPTSPGSILMCCLESFITVADHLVLLGTMPHPCHGLLVMLFAPNQWINSPSQGEQI